MVKKIVKIALACLLVGAVTVGVYAFNLYEETNEVIEKIGTPEQVAVAESAKVKPLTLLLMGIDHRPDTGSLNSDVIMIVTLNPDDQSATLVSIPRDMQLGPKDLPERKANYYYPYFYNIDKETAFANTKKVFQELLDVPVDYAVAIDFEGFRQTVDILGGLTLDVDMDMRYVDEFDGTNINLKKGVQKLNGKQALDFVRYRKSNRDTQDSSDLARNERQQQVMGEMLNSLKSAGGIVKLSQIIETAGNHIRTDVPSSQIRDLLSTYFNMNPSNIDYIHLNGTWVSPYIVVKDEDIAQARIALKLERGETLTASETELNNSDDKETANTNTYGKRSPVAPKSNGAVGTGTATPPKSGNSTVTRNTYGSTAPKGSSHNAAKTNSETKPDAEDKTDAAVKPSRPTESVDTKPADKTEERE